MLRFMYNVVHELSDKYVYGDYGVTYVVDNTAVLISLRRYSIIKYIVNLICKLFYCRIRSSSRSVTLLKCCLLSFTK